MAKVLRCIAAIVTGLIVAFVLVVAVEFFGEAVHPVPANFGGTMEEMCLHVERFPPWALALVVPAWAGTAFAGTWISGRIGNRNCAFCVGLLLIVAVVFNISMLPYPGWFKILNLILVPAASLLGSQLSIRRKAIVGDDLRRSFAPPWN